MNDVFSKPYNPKETEGKTYRLWEKSGYFNPDKLPAGRKKVFSIAMAPPNVTGSLHMGHALEYTLSDVLVRKKRMQGFSTLWLPGTDHAGIATQNVVEKELKKQGILRHDLGREKFLEKVWEWKEKYGDIILAQLKKLGASCDWSRLRFTMDENYQKAVKTAFLHYQKKGWIYRGERVVSWCARCRTSLSDLELEYKEEKGNLWYIRYPIKKREVLRHAQDDNNFIVVATTRPETMLGDAAVAVNPKDARYKNLVGKIVILPIQEREIPIIADRRIEQDFGTGAVKITPAHDVLDEAVAADNKLSAIKVIGEDGRMTKQAGDNFVGLKSLEAREKVLAILQEKNLLEKTEDYSHNMALCYRCSTVIEPLLSKQWFLKMRELANSSMLAVKNKKIIFHPKSFEKMYFNWLKNIKDWCISRQIWWGHKIPIKDVDDVLDTWFSSALWPFAILGWPEKTKDLKKFYPTNVLTNDRGIINLWDTRMIFSGLEFTKKVPFSDLIIHATILTREGKRMSKSLGTGIDPLQLIDNYGADAVRFGLLWQAMGGQDIRWAEEHVLAGKKFCNKIWNAARFVMQQTSTLNIKTLNGKPQTMKQTQADKNILKALKKTVKSTHNDLGDFQFGKAIRDLYDFFWHDFCDIYIEESKKQNNPEAQKILFHVFLSSLKLLHPFMPFVTEEIYQQLPLKEKKKCLMVENWPKS